MKVLLAVISLIALLAVGFWVQKPREGGNTSASAKDSVSLPEVQVIKPVRQDVAATLRLPANISPYQQTTLFSKISGYLKSVAADKGDFVRAGQVLAVIDDPELDQRYQQAQTEYEIKKVTYERLANVRKENPDVIAKQDVDVAEAAYVGA